MRLETIRLAGELAIPFTSGILIGIGETRAERIEALLALKALGRRARPLGEVIVQNFRAKPETRMADHPGCARSRSSCGRSPWHGSARRRLARAGAAEPRLRRLSAAPRRGNRRLGRCLAGHDRPRQSRGALARDRATARGDRVARPRRSRRGCRSTPSTSPTSTAGSTRRSLRPCAVPRTALGLAREDRWAPGEPVEVPFLVRRDAIPLELAR